MGEIVVTCINAIAPIILLILLGYFLKRIKLLNGGFLKTGNGIVFKVCLPCMLFINIYDKMNSFSDIRWDVVLYAVIVICVIFGLGLATAVLVTKRADRRGVILQCTFRSNFAVIGLALVDRLGGDVGIASVISAFSIPAFNVLAVIALTVFVKPDAADGDIAEQPRESKAVRLKKSVKSIALNIIKNPLIIGVLAGLLVVGIREAERACCGGAVPFALNNQLKFLYAAASDIKAMATPLALVILGGQFEFSAVRGMTKEIVVGTVWRIVLAPLLGIGAAALLAEYTPLFNDMNAVYPTLIALFGTPVAVSSAIMADAMKNDGQLATQYVVWTSICSIITLFVTVLILMGCGLMTV